MVDDYKISRDNYAHIKKKKPNRCLLKEDGRLDSAKLLDKWSKILFNTLQSTCALQTKGLLLAHIIRQGGCNYRSTKKKKYKDHSYPAMSLSTFKTIGIDCSGEIYTTAYSCKDLGYNTIFPDLLWEASPHRTTSNEDSVSYHYWSQQVP